MKKSLITLVFLFFAFTLSARDYKFDILSGKTVSYEEIKEMPEVVLFVWTTWCPHCREELERLQAKSIFFEGPAVFYVNAGESRNTVRKYADYKDFSSAVRDKTILDEDSFFARNFSVSAVPTYIFLKKGKLLTKTYYLTEELLSDIFGKN